MTALSEARLLPLTRAILLEKVQRDPNVALHFLKGLCFRIQEAAQAIDRTGGEADPGRAGLHNMTY